MNNTPDFDNFWVEICVAAFLEMTRRLGMEAAYYIGVKGKTVDQVWRIWMGEDESGEVHGKA